MIVELKSAQETYKLVGTWINVASGNGIITQST
jgi:hypothetical protein